jgi:hypothetical protein
VLLYAFFLADQVQRFDELMSGTDTRSSTILAHSVSTGNRIEDDNAQPMNESTAFRAFKAYSKHTVHTAL